jgi:hypothetical protein
MEAHHIADWASFPDKRFDVTNGVCLCRRCHRGVGGFHSVFPHGPYNSDMLDQFLKVALFRKDAV